MITAERSIRQSYVDLRGINLGVEFVRDAGLQPGQKYSLSIVGLEDEEATGTLDKSGFIGGLALLYNSFELKDGDKLKITYDGSVIRLEPPPDRRRATATSVATITTQPSGVSQLVFERQKLRRIHIEPFSPGNLGNWVPQTEADVYMVFGTVSEFTDFRYACGASKALLAKLGYQAMTKPDAILINRTTDEYLMAEFKMTSKDFASNHHRDDVDVLICWEDSECDRSKLPANVVGLRTLIERALKEGEIAL